MLFRIYEEENNVILLKIFFALLHKCMNICKLEFFSINQIIKG